MGVERIGFITGIEKEAEILRKIARYPNHDIACAGANSTKAYNQANELAKNGCNILISFGIAGALDPRLKSGDLVLANSLVNAEATTFVPDARQGQKLNIHLSTNLNISNSKFFGSTELISNAEKKQRLFKLHSASAVDMESLGVAQAAQENKCPFLIIRAIADTAYQNLPGASFQSIDKNGNIKIRSILWDLAKHPNDLPGLIKLAYSSRKALTSLSRVAMLGFGL